MDRAASDICHLPLNRSAASAFRAQCTLHPPTTLLVPCTPLPRATGPAVPSLSHRPSPVPSPLTIATPHPPVPYNPPVAPRALQTPLSPLPCNHTTTPPSSLHAMPNHHHASLQRPPRRILVYWPCPCRSPGCLKVNARGYKSSGPSLSTPPPPPNPSAQRY